MIYKLIGFTLFIYGVTSLILDGYPDAIACTQGFIRGRTGTTLYVWHFVGPIVYYCQVYGGEVRFISFHANGTYRLGTGHFESRAGCEGKSLSQLQAQGRWFMFADGDMIPSIRAEIVSHGRDINTFMAYSSDLFRRVGTLENSSMSSLRQNISAIERNQITQTDKVSSFEANITTLWANTSTLAQIQKQQNSQLKQKLQTIETAQSSFQKQTEIWRTICIVVIVLQFIAMIVLCVVLYKKRK